MPRAPWPRRVAPGCGVRTGRRRRPGSRAARGRDRRSCRRSRIAWVVSPDAIRSVVEPELRRGDQPPGEFAEVFGPAGQEVGDLLPLLVVGQAREDAEVQFVRQGRTAEFFEA